MTHDDTRTHMRAEIEDIPDALARLFATSGAALAEAGQGLASTQPPYIVTVARGSSDHAATFLKYCIELSAGVPVASIGPSIASIYNAKLKLGGSACIAISQSGKSPDIVAMANSARECGAMTIAITNTAGSPLAISATHAIDIAAGIERSVAATKTFVSSAAAGLAIVAHWQHDRALMRALETLPEHLARAAQCDWTPLAEAVGGQDSLFILGRGPSAAMANEAALKFKETSGVHAEAYSAAEVMHGPLALVGPGFPVLSLIARDAAQPSSLAVSDQLAVKGAQVFVTADGANQAHKLPFAPTGHPLTDPLSLIVSFYAFVEGFSRRRGLDPDRPRNLRKVTETV